MKSRFCCGWIRIFWDTVTIIVFLGLLWLPTLDHYFHLDHAPLTPENRRPAQWPVFEGVGQSRQYIAGIESYFDDHFGFRKRLIRWNNRWKDQLFDEPTSREVLVGQKGWLYYSGDEMLENWSGQLTLSHEDLENWRRLLEMRRNWLRARGIKYIMVLPPDKHAVYPEYLPDWVEKGSKPSKVQQLVRYMKEHSTVQVLDLTEPLIEAKKIRVEYLNTDTHWNLFGGFVGYRAVIEALSKQLPELKPLPMDAFKWEPMAEPAGDLALIMGETGSYTEKEAVKPVPVLPLPRLKPQEDPIRFPERDKTDSATTYTINPEATGKAIVFRDSFAGCWPGFLGQNFHEVIYVWQYSWNRPLIEREKPDVVIDEILERFFNIEDPVKLAQADLESETNPFRTSR